MNQKNCTLRVLDEVSVVILGLLPNDLEYFYEKYAVHAPNYFFHPKFRLGQWDGRVRFFHKTGKTYVYLLDDILPRVVNLQYKIQIEDKRTVNVVQPTPIQNNIFEHILHLDSSKPTILREHQLQAVNSLIEYGNGIVVAATSSGKTLMCAALIKAYDNQGVKSLTIVPNQDLIKQTKAEYINCQLDVGEYSGTTKTLNHKHVVSTWQALKNNPKIVSMFEMVIVDECHGIKGNILKKILVDHAGKIPYRFGFTGTMPKEKSDLWSVHVAVGPIRYTVGAAHLIEEGILANLHIDIIQLEEDLKNEFDRYVKDECIGTPPTYIQFKDGYFPDFSSEKSYLQHNEKRLDWIAECIEARRDVRKGNVLCLVDNIPFGRKLTKRIDGAIFVNGTDIKTAKERLQVYNMFKDNNNLVVIATVHIAGTGINIPRIFNMMFIDMGKSFIRVVQAIGRGLRKTDDKDTVTMTDICSDLKYSKRHVRERIKFYKEACYPYKKHKVNYTELQTNQDNLAL